MSTPMGPGPDPTTGSTPGGPPPPPGQYPTQQQPTTPATDTTQQYPQYAQAAPMPPQPPGLPTEPKKKKTGLIVTFVILGVVLVAVVGVGAYMFKKNQDAAKAREDFAGAETDFAKSYNEVLATAGDTDLDWEETVDKTAPLIEDSESAASSMDKASKELSGDESNTGEDLAAAASSIAKDMKSLQTELEDFVASDDLEYDLDPIDQLTTKLSESAAKYNELVEKWNGLDVVEGSDDLELATLEDTWADISGFAQRTLEDQQKAVVADFVAAFDTLADAFVASAQSFLDTMNSLVNTNPAGIPAATQPMLAGMTEAVAGMQELASSLDESSSPSQVADTATALLEIANQMVAASGDAATFNKLADEFNATLDEFNAAYAEYQEMATQYRDSGS